MIVAQRACLPQGREHALCVPYGRPHIVLLRCRTMGGHRESKSRCRSNEESLTGSTAAGVGEGNSGGDSAAPGDRCQTCGVPKSEMPMGCDGSGRIIGGIGAVPGFGWWPIKAYRPCGKAASAGIAYKRKGQGVDEVMFGRGPGE